MGTLRSLLPSRAPAGAGAESALGRTLHRDGTLLEAWASVKSYQRKDAKNTVPPDDPGNATVELPRGEAVEPDARIETDPDAKMARKGKGKEAKLSYNGNLLVENRNGLIVNTGGVEANGTAERDAALVMLKIPGTKQVNRGRRQGLRHGGFRGRVQKLKGHPARGPKPGAAPVGAPLMLVRRSTPDMPSVRGKETR